MLNRFNPDRVRWGEGTCKETSLRRWQLNWALKDLVENTGWEDEWVIRGMKGPFQRTVGNHLTEERVGFMAITLAKGIWSHRGLACHAEESEPHWVSGEQPLRTFRQGIWSGLFGELREWVWVALISDFSMKMNWSRRLVNAIAVVQARQGKGLHCG